MGVVEQRLGVPGPSEPLRRLRSGPTVSGCGNNSPWELPSMFAVSLNPLLNVLCCNRALARAWGGVPWFWGTQTLSEPSPEGTCVPVVPAPCVCFSRSVVLYRTANRVGNVSVCFAPEIIKRSRCCGGAEPCLLLRDWG